MTILNQRESDRGRLIEITTHVFVDEIISINQDGMLGTGHYCVKYLNGRNHAWGVIHRDKLAELIFKNWKGSILS